MLTRYTASLAVAVACGMVALAAAAYGGVEPWGELALVLLAGLAMAIGIVEGVRNGLPRTLIVALGACLLLALFAWTQSIELPAAVIKAVSPVRHATVSELLGQAPDWFSLSYHSADTRRSLRLLLIGVSVFAVVAVSVREDRTAGLLLLGLFSIGVAEALLAIAQQALDAPGIYWGPVTAGHLRSGSFVNHSNFSQFLNLTIGASLGLLLCRLSQDRRDLDPRQRREDGLRGVFRRQGWLLIGIAVQATAVAASLSRAGVASMLVASCVAALLLGKRRDKDKSTWALAAIPLFGFLGVAWLGFDSFFERVETLHGEAPLSDRIALGIATLRVGLDHWLTGAGLGAHASVFPAYDTTSAVAFAEQADNDYAQLFEETGLPGCLLVSLFVAFIWYAVRGLLNRRGDPIRYAGVGVAYGMVAVAIQSLTDFGLRLPAVLAAAAALTGLAVGLSNPTSGRDHPMNNKRRLGGVAAAVLLAGAWTGALISSIAEYRAERWWSVAYDLEQRVRFAGEQADPQDYLDMVASAERAAEIQPDRPKYRFWLNAYRWQAVSFASRQGTGASAEPSRGTALAIAERLEAARRVGPTFGPAYTLEGQLRLAAADPSGTGLLRKGVRLSPNDPVACFAAASEQLRGEPDHDSDQAAFDLLSRAVLLDPDFYLEAAQTAINERGGLDQAVRFAEKTPKRLMMLANWLKETGDEAAATLVLQKADAAQEERINEKRANSVEIAAFAARRASLGGHEDAVTLYRKALNGRFDRVDWRLALVDSLIELGQYAEAKREAGVCQRQKPQLAAVRERLNVLDDLVPDSPPAGLEPRSGR